MVLKRCKRWLVCLGIVLLGVSLLLGGGFFFATRALKTQVEQALGAHGEVGEIRVGFSAIEIIGLRIKAAEGWPAADELRARRVVIHPDLRALLSKQLRISRIEVEDAYLSLLRRKEGKLEVLPALLDRKESPPSGENPGKPGASGHSLAVELGGLSLKGGVVEFFDASLGGRTPHKLRLEQVNARLGAIRVPDLKGRTDIDVQGTVKGVRQDGTFSIQGNAEFSSRDSEITAQLRGVDLVALQPYLMKAAETGVRRGALDLDVHSVVRDNRLRAPATLTLSGLELSSGGSFMGVPRAAVIALLKDKSGKITLKFLLEGNIDDPRFSLNEHLVSRLGTSLAGVLGISLEGLAKGVGTTGSGLVKGVGDTLNKLFGK